MAIKKIKLPNNSTVDINDARDVPIIDSDGYIDSETGDTIKGVATYNGYCAFPGCNDGATEDFTLATTGQLVFKPGTGTNSVRNSRLTTAQSQASGEGGVSILGTSVGNYAVSAGDSCIARGQSAYAEGYNTETGGEATSNTKAMGTSMDDGSYAHAEGNATIAEGRSSHAEGTKTLAVSVSSHAEGDNTFAYGAISHAEGYYTQTRNTSEHAEGKYNKSTSGTTLHSVGIGTSNSARKNAHEITTDGKHYILGVGGYDGTNVTASGVQDLATVINSGSNGLVIHEVSDSGSTTAGTWKATASGVTALTDGLTIRYKLVVAGAATTTLNLNNLGAKTVYRFNTTKLTTHYAVGSYIILTYNSSLNSGCWITVDGYDSNSDTHVRQYVANDNNEYSLLARYATASVSSYQDNYTRFADGVTVNPSTDTITASGFKVTGGTSSQVLTANGSTRSITISSSEPTSGTGSDGDIWIVI